MSDLEIRIANMSVAKQAMLRKLLKGKAVKLDEQQAVQTLISAPQAYYDPFEPRSFQQAQIARAETAGYSDWFFMETQLDALEVTRFVDTINQLVAHHPMLRTRLENECNKAMLQTQQYPDWQAEVIDLREVDETAAVVQLALLRSQFQAPRTRQSVVPLQVTICQLKQSKWRMLLGVDLMLLDLVSLEFLALQWRQVYEGRKAITEIAAASFRDYCQTERAFQKSSREWQSSKEYWLQKLTAMPAVLTANHLIAANTAASEGVAYRVDMVSKPQWLAIKSFASEHKLTGSMVIYSLFTLVLAKMTELSQFALEMRLFNRISFDAKVNDILGQYSSGIFSKISVDPQLKFIDYCRRLESQTWADLDHGFYDVVSEQSKVKAVSDARIVFTSTISRYSEFVEEGVVPPMKWFGEMKYGVAYVPGQALELLIVENASALELHWFADPATGPAALGQIIESTGQLIRSVARSPAAVFESDIAQLSLAIHVDGSMLEALR